MVKKEIRDIFRQAREKVGRSTAAIKQRSAKYFEDRRKEKEEKEAFWKDEERQKQLAEYTELADHILNKYKTHETGQRFRRKIIAGGAGATAAAGVYGMTGAYSFVRDATNTIVHETQAAKKMLATARQLAPGSDKAKIKEYLQANDGFAKSLGQTLQQYQTNIQSREQTINDLKVTADALGRIAQKAPGWNSETVKGLSGIRNKINKVIVETVTGKDQSDRLSSEYSTNYNELQKLIEDAQSKKLTTNKQIKDILERVNSLSNYEQQNLVKERGELERLMKQHNTYTKFIQEFNQLDTKSIRDKGTQYQQLVKEAEREHLTTPIYQDMGTLISLGIGALAAYYVGKTTNRWLGWMVPHSKFDTEKTSRTYLEDRAQKDKENLEKKKPSGIEGTLEAVLVALAIIVLVATGTQVSGLAIAEQTTIVKSAYIPLIFSALFSVVYLSSKIYKASKNR